MTSPSDTARLPGQQPKLPSPDLGAELPLEELAALIEALLLVAPEPPSIDDLAAGAHTCSARVEEALTLLVDRHERGWIVQRHGDRVQLATAPRFAPYLRAFLHLDREARLSSAALETLAIVAYQQPVTRSEIEAIRGVDCSGVLATLHARGLIEPVSRRATVGNPIQYGTSADFLKHFGLGSLADLPPIGQVNGVEGRKALADAMAPTETGPAAEESTSRTHGGEPPEQAGSGAP
ncbi:MAG TPA: SMC-Scp complex subunit ScpB [Thermomicrobiales bacterium]|nr:SMC-Scp complex subunit ScpB [Thermomicrobiales bacterium]